MSTEFVAVPTWVDAEQYPFKPRAFSTPEGQMAYLDEGQGPVVLFVHGTPSWGFEWRHVIAALRSTHRCVAVDHLGFGLSDKPETGSPEAAALTPADQSRRLSALVAALDLRDITLVVHDFGGPIGLAMALDHPARIARLVVMNTWMWSTADDPAVSQIDSLVRSGFGRFLYRWLNASPRFLMPAVFGDKRLLTKAIHRHYLMPFARRKDREGPYACALALRGSDPFYDSLWSRRQLLAAKPMTVLWGEKDKAFGPKYLERWIAAFPTAAIIRLAKIGHFVAEEAPQSVASAVRSL